jgi:hypothetical protein
VSTQWAANCLRMPRTGNLHGTHKALWKLQPAEAQPKSRPLWTHPGHPLRAFSAPPEQSNGRHGQARLKVDIV